MGIQPNHAPGTSLELVTVTASDGHTFGMRLYWPEAPSDLPPIMFAPAMGVKASFYDPAGTALSSQGIPTAVIDLRGNDTSSLRASRDCDFGYFEIVEHDLPAAAEHVLKLTGGQTLIVGGHSLGGQLSCLFAGRRPDIIAGIVLLASCSVHYRQWPFPHDYGTFVFEQLAHLIARIIGYFPGRIFRFGHQEARRLVRDWSYQGKTGTYRIPELNRDMESDLAELRTDIFAAYLTDDFYCPEPAVSHLLSKMPNSRTTRHALSPSDFGADRVGHFGWARHAGLIAGLIAEWHAQNHNRADNRQISHE